LQGSSGPIPALAIAWLITGGCWTKLLPVYSQLERRLAVAEIESGAANMNLEKATCLTRISHRGKRLALQRGACEMVKLVVSASAEETSAGICWL